MMKRTVALALICTGCATGTKSPEAIKSVYVETIVPVSANEGSSSARGTCAEGSKKIKNLTWKEKLKVANACVTSGQWETVEAVGSHIAEKEHQSPWGPYYLSLAAESKKDFARAMWMIDLASKKSPKNGILLYQMARLQWISGDRHAALKTFDTALGLNPRLPDAHAILGQIALLDGKFGEAEKRFQKALHLQSGHHAALLGMSEVKIQKKLYKEATDFLGQAIAKTPSSYQARARQAYVFESLEKNYPEALAAYRRIQNLHGKRRLDAAVDIDLDAKIRNLETMIKNAVPSKLTLREPAKDKKVTK